MPSIFSLIIAKSLEFLRPWDTKPRVFALDPNPHIEKLYFSGYFLQNGQLFHVDHLTSNTQVQTIKIAGLKKYICIKSSDIPKCRIERTNVKRRSKGNTPILKKS